MKNKPFHIEALEARLAPAVLYAVTASDHLVTFDSAAPGVFLTDVAIFGLNAGEDIVALDLRPETGELYAFTTDDRLMRVNTNGDANPVTGIVGLNPMGTSVGLDFDPSTDQLHLITSVDEHFRYEIGGTAQAVSLPELSYAAGDVNFLANPAVSAVAFTNSYARATTSEFFGIDHGQDVLVAINRETGKLRTIGALGENVVAGTFEITGPGTALLAEGNGAALELFEINLDTGAATLVGTLPSGSGIRGMAAIPAKLVDIRGNTATYTELDGDLVTIKISKGTFSPENFVFSGPADGVGTLFEINLGTNTPAFFGANITMTAKPSPMGGDGFASLGRISAVGIDLGKVLIDGDLGRIVAGNSELPAFGLKSLTVQSLGALGDGAGAGDRVSRIQGSVGSLLVRGDIKEAQLHVDDSSSATALGRIGVVNVGGSLVGGANPFEGSIIAEGLGTVKVRGDLVGGSGDNAGSILAPKGMGSLQVGGSLRGGMGLTSGTISAVEGHIQFVKVGGSLIGSSGSQSGSVVAFTKIGSATITGSVLGGEGSGSAVITANDTLGVVKIGGDFIGNGDFSALIGTNGSVAAVNIGGSVITGEGELSASIFAGVKLGPIKIGGDLRGSEERPATIVATGNPTAAGTTDVGIQSILVKGRVERAFITAGNALGNLAIINADAQIGSVKVGGDWISSVLVAGTTSGIDHLFGTEDDAPPSDANDSPTIVSRIARITIGGQVRATFGSISTTDHYGFIAQQIGSFSVGGTKLKLTPGVGNDNASAGDPRFLLGPTGDVRLHEVAPVVP